MPTEAAPAKINLALHVTGRRADGYHTLDSLVVFAGVHDRLTARPDAALSLTVEGPFASGLATEPDNLVLRAARALAARHGLKPGAALTLQKHLPVASGIGGGSSDAAASLRLLAALWRLPASPADLHAIAAGLGADVPVCLDPVPRRMTGVGDILSPAPDMPECGIVLVNPGVALSTQSVFRARSGAFSPGLSLTAGWADAAGMARDLARQANDLEPPAIALCPVLDDVLSALGRVRGCHLARMSGSGATCFGLFSTATEAASSAAALARPGWWCWGGPLWPSPSRPLYGTPTHT